MNEQLKQLFKGFGFKGMTVEADLKTPWNEDVTVSMNTGSRKPKPKAKKESKAKPKAKKKDPK